MGQRDTPPASPSGTFSAKGISMSFSGVEVLSDISLRFQPGQVHAIIGENGAGKSTLMKIISGYLKPTLGSLLLDGDPLNLAGPNDAEKRGIVLVHQEILLAPHLTIAQNIFLGRELRTGIFVDDGRMNTMAAAKLAELGVSIKPSTLVERLSIANRQLVQIARALSNDPKIIIFDEPTASLTPVESAALFQLIAQLKKAGRTIIYISHKLQEVKNLADVVTVLRDGKHVTTQAADSLTPLQMANLMVGRDMSKLYPAKPASNSGQVRLAVENFSVPGFVHNASFKVHQGEILGFAGLVGAGRTELFEGLLSLRAHGPNNKAFSSARAAMESGVAYITEDRKGKGLLLDQPLAENLTLAVTHEYQKYLVMNRTAEAAALQEATEEFDIRTKSSRLLAGQLSGGNQQKLLLAKMLMVNPTLVIIDEPTRGVDIGAKEQIYKFVAGLAAQGKAVIVISSEMQELIGLCHRILVMRNGEIAGEVSGDDISESNIVVLATGASKVAA